MYGAFDCAETAYTHIHSRGISIFPEAAPKRHSPYYAGGTGQEICIID
jgi:hypothetical protein